MAVHKSREGEREGELKLRPVGLKELEASVAFVDGVCT
jgi:hypothetical protein